MVLATEEPTWLNNEIIVFYVKHLFSDNVKFKGILDMDYFEEKSNPLQFYEGKELQWNVPPNPFEFASTEYKLYNDMVSEFKKVEGVIIALLVDCCGVEHHEFETFHIEMESLTW